MPLASSKPLPLSVCMISGPESARIGHALESVYGWAGEIIVVLNDDIQDGTDRIAERYGARVFREPWRGFVAQKNSAASKASQPWILGLDADEVVSSGLREEIADALSEKATGPVAWTVPRLTFYFGRWIRHGDWYPDRCVRLWRRGQARWTGIDPHAKLEVGGEIRKLRHDLLHYTADTLNRQVAKTVTYADDFARHCQSQGRPVTLLELLVRPAWRFVRAYIFKLGFLDGWQGYTIAWLTAFYTFLRYARARETQAGSAGQTAPRREDQA